MDFLKSADPAIFDAITEEEHRQRDELELIASENYTSAAVMEAVGSVLTNKYAEGLPGKRYYGGCEFVDKVEQLAIDRAKALFGAQHANVQPHSGASANQAVYYATLEPGDTVLAMDLAHGGHLTHGMKLNFSGRYYPHIGYGLDPNTERIDYDKVAALAREHKPKLILAGASAYARAIVFDKFEEVAREVGAIFFARHGRTSPAWSPAGLHPNPFPVADFVTSTTHKTLRGPRGRPHPLHPGPGEEGRLGGLPRPARGAAHARDRGQGRLPWRGDRPDFKGYAAQIIANARVLAEELMSAGFRLISGGTDNHLVLIDMTSRGLTGKIAEGLLGHRAGITVNKNLIPVRPAAAARPQRHPDGHSRPDDAWAPRGWDEAGRRLDRPRSSPPPTTGPLAAARTREAIREFRPRSTRSPPTPSPTAWPWR